MKRFGKNVMEILLYSVICYVIIIPFKIWITGISISLLVGMLFGLLNSILTQLRRLNSNSNNKSELLKS